MGNENYPPGTFCWNEMGSTDVQAAKKFYTDLFGWVANDKPMPADMGTYTLLQINGEDVAGMYALAGPQFEGVPSHWMGYVSVSDVDATAQQAEKLGAEITAPPMDVPDIGRMAMLKDPTGAHIAVINLESHCGMAKVESPNGVFCWNECMSNDVEASKSFYTTLFGWTAETQQMGDISYTMLNSGETTVAGLMAMPPGMENVPPYWMAYVTVEDCDATVKKVEATGGKVCAPPMDIPTVGRFAVIADPSGGAIAIITLSTLR